MKKTVFLLLLIPQFLFGDLFQFSELEKDETLIFNYLTHDCFSGFQDTWVFEFKNKYSYLIAEVWHASPDDFKKKKRLGIAKICDTDEIAQMDRMAEILQTEDLGVWSGGGFADVFLDKGSKRTKLGEYQMTGLTFFDDEAILTLSRILRSFYPEWSNDHSEIENLTLYIKREANTSYLFRIYTLPENVGFTCIEFPEGEDPNQNSRKWLKNYTTWKNHETFEGIFDQFKRISQSSIPKDTGNIQSSEDYIKLIGR